MNNQTHAEQLLHQTLGSKAHFRDGQWEAIDALVNRRERVLVVQRTGWGKSLVYFAATRLLREQGTGVTLLISPLLSLMRNQIDSAAAWGLNAATLNSDNADDHTEIERRILVGEVDLLLISPERLANDRFLRNIWDKLRKRVGLVVIDEAHCISDWGHDFRPNYRRIMPMLEDIPSDTPILGTTATANDRVVADVAAILGAGINIQRGTLTRESLSLYVYPDPMDSATRLTLLSYLMSRIKGSGIIYCTTTRDCRIVADWLQSEGHNAKAYYADVEESGSETRVDLENQLMNNEVKALVSSVALGMGFDKSDLHFVVHYQLPGNIISYYQQIGRAGRGIDNAHIVLMYGAGDEEIQDYFIRTAFPQPEQIQNALDALSENGDMGRSELQRYVNARQSVLEKILTHLEVEEIIEKRDSAYHLLKTNTTPDYARWNEVTKTRYRELDRMKAYIHETGCLMRFIALELDDPRPIERCGRCKNCTGAASKFTPNSDDVQRANDFLRHGKPITFEPRKRYPAGVPGIAKTTIAHVNETGIALCGYYDEGWGALVRRGRGSSAFADELLTASVDLLRKHIAGLKEKPEIVVGVPSLRRPSLVPGLAKQIAKSLNLPYSAAVEHRAQHPPQTEMRNSFQQASNVQNRYAVTLPFEGERVLLIDDVADSKWTLTVLGELLRKNGAAKVYPFTLAVTNTGE